jgi:uncharacterized protein YraI
VRGQPLASNSPLGLIDASTAIDVLGKDASGKWFQIIYEKGQGGLGWVSAEYVRVPDAETLPIAGDPSGLAATGEILQQINVRSGPGTAHNALGTLNPGEVVTPTGKDSASLWLQIEFSGGPEGKAWVAMSFVRLTGVENVPIVAGSGEVIGTSTPTVSPPTAAPTPTEASEDNDSAQAPVITPPLSPTGAGAVLYSSDVSAPAGDRKDWIGFRSSQSGVTIELVCSGNGTLEVEIRGAGKTLPDGGGISCGRSERLRLAAGQSYVLTLSVIDGAGDLQYVRYTLSIRIAR